MSKIFWSDNRVVSFVIALLVMFMLAGVFYLGVDKGRFDRAPYNHTQHYSEYTDAEIGNICGASTTTEKAVECAIKNKTKYRDAKRAEFDLAAQSGMAHWTFIMAIASVFATILTGVGVWIIWRTLDSTDRALSVANNTIEVTREIGQKQVRSYLDVGEVKFSIRHKDSRFAHIEFLISNNGQSPTRSVSYQLVLKAKGTVFENGEPISSPIKTYTSNPIWNAAPNITAGGNQKHSFKLHIEEIRRLHEDEGFDQINIKLQVLIRSVDIFENKNKDRLEFEIIADAPIGISKLLELPPSPTQLQRMQAVFQSR